MRRIAMAGILTGIVMLFGVTCAATKKEANPSKDFPARPTPREIAELVRKVGAADVTSTLFGKKEAWNHVLQGIASGNREWLQVAALLHNGSDAGSSEELELAAADALRQNAGGVLEILEAEFTAETLCGNEESLADTLDRSLAIISERRKAVSAVKAKTLQQRREKCLSLLDDLERLVKENGDSWFSR